MYHTCPAVADRDIELDCLKKDISLFIVYIDIAMSPYVK